MTDSLLRRAHRVLAPVQRRDIEPALELCAADPVANVVPAMQLEIARDTGKLRTGLWAMRRKGASGSSLHGVVWCGANFTAVLPTEAPDESELTRAELAEAMVSRLPRPASLVGERELTLDLWGRVEPWWGPPRIVRERQVSMLITSPARHAPTPLEGLEQVRQARLDDYDIVLPACVDMFRGEVGYDPMLHGRHAYEQRLKRLIELGRAYIQVGVLDGQRCVVAKAEIGALGGGVAQLHGVWVDPRVRGKGVARASLAPMIDAIHAHTAPTVSLYVNDFNVAAIKAYEAVGFERVGDFATVML